MAIDLSPIQVGEIQILESSFLANPDADITGDENAVNIQFKSSDPTDADEEFKRISAMLSIESKASEGSESTYSARIVVRGLFFGHYADEEIDDGFTLFMKVNAYSLLYGFIRSHVQQLSSMSPIGQVNLPCVDVQSIAENIANLEKKIDA